MESLKHIYKIGRGPSSSHTMGPEYACQYVLNNYPKAKKIDVTLFGSLALTGKGHLTDKIIYETLKNIEVTVVFDYLTQKNHPNTMGFKIFDKDNNMIDNLLIYSIGGGNIQIEGKQTQLFTCDVYPFKSFSEIKQYCIEHSCELHDVVYKFEGEDIKKHLLKVLNTMEECISSGIKKEGELPGGLHVLRKAKQLYVNSTSTKNIVRLVSCFAFAASEENASGGTIVTAPTCGSCGVLPAILLFLKKNKKLSDNECINALATAGLIGNVIKMNASVSGAFAGCQAEIGSACSMAAAACSYIEKYSIEEIEYSAEIALEHHLGLTCDPINGLVQIPCIERNAVAALRAYDASQLAHYLNGTRKVSFDTVVKTMVETGIDLNEKYRETSQGGLAKNYNCK